MKPFRFSLQVLRTIREQKEQVALKRYAEARRAAEEAVARVTANQEELSSCWMLLQELLGAGIASDHIGRLQGYNQFLQERHVTLEKVQRDAEKHAAKTWDDMRAAMRERETLDKFHDRQRHAYDLNAQREEQKQLDEMASRLTGLTEAWHS